MKTHTHNAQCMLNFISFQRWPAQKCMSHLLKRIGLHRSIPDTVVNERLFFSSDKLKVYHMAIEKATCFEFILPSANTTKVHVGVYIFSLHPNLAMAAAQDKWYRNFWAVKYQKGLSQLRTLFIRSIHINCVCVPFSSTHFILYLN